MFIEQDSLQKFPLAGAAGLLNGVPSLSVTPQVQSSFFQSLYLPTQEELCKNANS
jgi:hypothetical protein